MTGRTPKIDEMYQGVAKVPPPKAADYSDELTAEQLDTLRQCAPQDESQMGALVYEFRWNEDA